MPPSTAFLTPAQRRPVTVPASREDPTSKLARSEAGARPSTHRSLRSEARRPWPMKRWSNSSLQVIDPKASAAPSWSGTMSIATARSTSDPLDGLCMLTAVLRRCSSVRLSTAVQGDIASTMHDLAMLIAAAHQCVHAQQACRHAEAAQSGGRASQVLTAVYGHGAKRLAELSHAMRTTDTGRLWLPAAHARRHQHWGR